MKGTVNGKSLDQVLSELKAPFPEEELKKNEKNETYIPVESLESRLNSVNRGFKHMILWLRMKVFQEVLGRFVVVAKTILIIYDDERNALIRKSALGGSNIIVVKDTGKPSSLKTDIAAAQSESFKNVCKLLQIGISQIRSGKQRRGQNGTKQRREEKNLYKIRFTSSLSAGNKCYKADCVDIATEEKFLFVIFSGQYSKIEKYVEFSKFVRTYREGKELAFYGRKDEFHGQRRIVFEEPSVKE